MINKILVALDSSDRNKSVFDTAVSLAQATGASLMLLHILSEEEPDYPLLPTYAYYAVLKDSNGGVFQEEFSEYTQKGLDFLKNLAKEAIAAGVETEYSQLSGLPGWEICEAASNWSADLIVVGSRGFKGLNEMFVGSISNYVTHHAPCSVLIVRSNTDSVSNSTSTPFQEEEEADSRQEVATDY